MIRAPGRILGMHGLKTPPPCSSLPTLNLYLPPTLQVWDMALRRRATRASRTRAWSSTWPRCGPRTGWFGARPARPMRWRSPRASASTRASWRTRGARPPARPPRRTRPGARPRCRRRWRPRRARRRPGRRLSPAHTCSLISARRAGAQGRKRVAGAALGHGMPHAAVRLLSDAAGPDARPASGTGVERARMPQALPPRAGGRGARGGRARGRGARGRRRGAAFAAGGRVRAPHARGRTRAGVRRRSGGACGLTLCRTGPHPIRIHLGGACGRTVWSCALLLSPCAWAGPAGGRACVRVWCAQLASHAAVGQLWDGCGRVPCSAAWLLLLGCRKPWPRWRLRGCW